MVVQDLSRYSEIKLVGGTDIKILAPRVKTVLHATERAYKYIAAPNVQCVCIGCQKCVIVLGLQSLGVNCAELTLSGEINVRADRLQLQRYNDGVRR